MLLCGHIGLNKRTETTGNFYIKFTFNSAIQCSSCYEFKPDTELLKTCVNAMNTLLVCYFS